MGGPPMSSAAKTRAGRPWHGSRPQDPIINSLAEQMDDENVHLLDARGNAGGNAKQMIGRSNELTAGRAGEGDADRAQFLRGPHRPHHILTVARGADADDDV